MSTLAAQWMSTPQWRGLVMSEISSMFCLLKFHGNNFEEFYSFLIYAHITIGKLISHHSLLIFHYCWLRQSRHCGALLITHHSLLLALPIPPLRGFSASAANCFTHLSLLITHLCWYCQICLCGDNNNLHPFY
jgi:hypothetical protein